MVAISNTYEFEAMSIFRISFYFTNTQQNIWIHKYWKWNSQKYFSYDFVNFSVVISETVDSALQSFSVKN